MLYRAFELLKDMAAKLRGIFPSRIPVGATEFKAFTDSVLRIYGIEDQPSYHQAIATMIMHINAPKHWVSKYFLARSVKNAMAKQVAYEMIDQIRQKEKQDRLAAQATLAPAAAPDTTGGTVVVG